MDRKQFPLLVVPAVPNGAGIRFLHSRERYDIDEYVDEIWHLLSLCSGHWSTQEICAKVAKEYPKLTAADVQNILDDLMSLGVLIDSRHAFMRQHSLECNPMPFISGMTFDDIAEYTDSPRMSVASGKKNELSVKESSLTILQSKRRSCRSFDASKRITERQLGQVLVSSYSLPRHSVPSAGGLYPLKIYVIVTKDQQNIGKGYYEYNSEDESLVQFSDEVDHELLQYALDSDSLLFNAPVIVVIAADLGRHSGKYSNRGYRYTLLEAGHFAQNMQLAAPLEGLATIEYGGFLDEVIATELQMPSPAVAPIVVVGLGTPSSESTFNAMKVLQELDKELVGPSKPIRYVRMNTGHNPEKGETFFGAEALYKPSPYQDTRRSYKERFAGGTATSSGLAQLKAVAEGYERYASGLVRVDQTESANALSDEWLDPRVVMPLTAQQLERLPHLQGFDPDTLWEWVRGINLSTGATTLVPVDLAFYPINTSAFNRKLIHDASSSGVAAHTDKEQAIERGLLELIERDAVMRNWFKRTSPKKIAHSQLPYHWRRRVEYWQKQGREVHVLDLSLYGVTTINVIITSDDFPSFIDGSASSTQSFNEALAKAFHECELMLIHTLRHPNYHRIDPKDVRGPLDHVRLYSHPEHLKNLEWLWGGEQSYKLPEPSADAKSLITRFEAISVTLSPESAPLHVVRILSKNLVPISFGYGTEHYAHHLISDADVDVRSLRLPHYFA